MTAPAQGWGWRLRKAATEPQAAVAWGAVAPRLNQQLRSLSGAVAARLQVCANRDVLVVCGATADLPWLDGVEYAAPDALAPALWLPTTWEPDVPVELLEQALSARFSRTPLLLWREPQVLVPLDRQLPLNPALLQELTTCWATH